jgi:hypothetical protein
MTATVKFKDGKTDNYLASAIRGLAAQAAGDFSIVRGQNNIGMLLTGDLKFQFNNAEKAHTFKKAVKTYIASDFQNDFIIEISN